MFASIRPRRSVLYMPGSNPRALAKGKTLPVDSIILDMEDAVSPKSKTEARQIIAEMLSTREDYGRRELTVRVNSPDTEWGPDDLVHMVKLDVDAIVLPKVESAEMIDNALSLLNSNKRKIPIWCMIETPLGVMHVEEIAVHPNVTCLVMGTSDLTKDLRSLHTPQRLPMLTSLSWCILAARAAGIAILDGVHLDIGDEDGFSASCIQGRELGFDGKTLIHPNQIDAANRCFSPDREMVEWSQKIIAAFEQSAAEGHGVTVVDGKLVENLHVEEANRLISLHSMILELEGQQAPVHQNRARAMS